ncbi:MAG: hypothetical protein JEZ14_11395 [Marinilabiliaceae bacterium]|nr:hypothetical protein [Marinilabiliaceae bacterium]
MKQLFITLSLILLQSCLIILHSQNNTIVQLPDSDSSIYSFTTSADGQVLYYANENSITQFSLVNKEVVKTIDIQVDSPVISILVHSNTNTILLGTKSGQVMAVSNLSGESLFVKDYTAGSINALALSGDDRSFLCGCENGMVYQQSIKEADVVSEFYQHDKAITSIEVSKKKQLIAISSADGSISLFKEPTNDWIDKLFIGKKWVRKVVINANKDRLLCVGDDGNLYEWNIANINKSRLISQTKVSRNWLLSLDTGHEGKIECWGGLDHLLKVRTQFGTYEQKLKGPILKAKFIKTDSSEVFIACCILGKGIQIIPVKEMKYKPIYN